jgi:prophage regulatory protein
MTSPIKKRIAEQRPERLLITFNEVMDLTRLSRAQLYKMMNRDEFPRAVHLSTQKRCWLYSEVADWVENLVAERDSAA